MSSDLAFARMILQAEAQAIARAADMLDDRFVAAVDLCGAAAGRIVVCGLGKSGHAGRKLSATLSSTNTPSSFLHAAEALHGDLGVLCRGDVLIAITNSGATREVVDVASVARQRDIPVIGITGRSDSPLSRISTVNLLLHVDAEADPLNLAPTSSVVATIALGDALALALMRRRGDGPASFASHHPAGSLGQRLRDEPEDQ